MTWSPETAGPSSRSLAFWVASSLERIGSRDAAGDGRAATIRAARGEYEAFQIVVRAPSDGLHDARLIVSDLTGPENRVISKRYISTYREHYVNVTRASPEWNGRNRSLGAGWYSDALIPLDGYVASGKSHGQHTFAVKAGWNQPFWIDVFVPRHARPGIYKGTIRVLSREGSVEIPIALEVWNFELPLRPTLKSIFGYWSPARQGVEELLRHKIAPGRLRSDPCTSGSCGELARMERSLMSTAGLSAADLGFWSGADAGNCEMLPPPSVKQLRSAAAIHEEQLDLFNYTADEIRNCPDIYPALKKWARNLHLAGIENLVVIEPTPELFDDGLGNGRSAVDIWVVLPNQYDASREWIGRALAKGDEVWSYNTLAQDSYSPKWLIDYEPVNFRIQPGFLSQSLGLTGIFYWRVDRPPQDRWDDVNNIGVFEAANYPGEGMLFYSGEGVGGSGVIPSIRLKQIREGIEDYEYIETLKRLGRSDWAMSLVKKVAPDWTHWSQDRGELETIRRKLGEEIDRLQSDRSLVPE